MKYNNVTLGHIEAIINKLGGEKGMKDFLAGKLQVVRDARFQDLTLTGTLIIPSTTLKKKDAFKHRGGGSNEQYHSDNFKNIILAHANDVLVSSGMKSKKYTLTKNLSDLEICNELGGESAVCVRSYDEVLITLYHIMQDEKYRDGKANIVYFKHDNVLLSAYCYWHGSEWRCDAGPARPGVWGAGPRVFTFAPEPQN